MKVKKFKINPENEKNGLVTSDFILPTDDIITIHKGYFEESVDKVTMLEYFRDYTTKYKYVYFLYRGGNKFQTDGRKNNLGYFISLNLFQKNKFLWMQNDHWLQKEKNIRYIINIVLIILGMFKLFEN